MAEAEEEAPMAEAEEEAPMAEVEEEAPMDEDEEEPVRRASEVATEHSKHAEVGAGIFTCVCGRNFQHAPAFLIHKKFCNRAILSEEFGDFLYDEVRRVP